MVDFTEYSSNLNNNQLANKGIPGFVSSAKAQGQTQEFQNGLSLSYAELGIVSPVDPYFNFYSNIPVTETGVTLEEAFFVTTALSAGLQMKAGKFKSNFSRLDAQHPHAWDFKDIALPYKAFLGTEGLGGDDGVQATFLPEFPFYTLFGAEVLQGQNSLLFGTGGNAGDSPHAFTTFVKSSLDTSDNSTIYFGPSVLFGKTNNSNVGNAVAGSGSAWIGGGAA